MAVDTLVHFILITSAVSLSPGPVMLLCLALGSRLPLRLVCAAMLGASLGNCALMLFSALGVGSLVALWPNAFGAVAVVGGVYLFYLGLMLWRAPWVDLTSDVQPQAPAFNTLMQRGFWVAASNPKGIVYFGALIPPFLHQSEHYLLTTFLLTGIFLTIDLAVMLAYAKLGHQLTHLIKTPAAQRRCNRLLASFLMLMALWLLADTLHIRS